MVNGSVVWWRFLVSAGFAACVSLGLAAAIIGGVIPVAFASDQPIPMRMAGGTADGLAMQTGGLGGVGGGSTGAARTYGAKVHLDSAHISGLCLAPEIGFPGTALSLGIRLSMGPNTAVDDVTLGTARAEVASIGLPPMAVGTGGAVGTAEAPDQLVSFAKQLGISADQVSKLANADSPVNGVVMKAGPGTADIGAISADVYNLKLSKGVDLGGLSAGVHLGGSASCD